MTSSRDKQKQPVVTPILQSAPKPAPLPLAYYRNENTLFLAQDLLGKKLCTQIPAGQHSAGIICETEAYLGAEDRASHAWQNRRTPRTQTMFQAGGVAYVYLCYGIHHLFNIVCHGEHTPHAILIRAIFPSEGCALIRQRSGIQSSMLIDGPGKISKALGITTAYDAESLTGSTIWLENTQLQILPQDVVAAPRIGVQYAGEHALLPYRFRLSDHRIQTLGTAMQKPE